jgi:hypothetical protein
LAQGLERRTGATQCGVFDRRSVFVLAFNYNSGRELD